MRFPKTQLGLSASPQPCWRAGGPSRGSCGLWLLWLTRLHVMQHLLWAGPRGAPQRGPRGARQSRGRASCVCPTVAKLWLGDKVGAGKVWQGPPPSGHAWPKPGDAGTHTHRWCGWVLSRLLPLPASGSLLAAVHLWPQPSQLGWGPGPGPACCPQGCGFTQGHVGLRGRAS